MRNKRITILYIVFIFFLFLPVMLLLLKSVSYGWRWGELVPTGFSLRGFEVLLNDHRFYSAVGMTLWIGLAVILLNLLLAIPAARALAFHSFRGKSLVETVLVLPILIPSLAVAMGIHVTMIRLGLADQWLGVVMVHLIPTVPYSIKILRSGFERLGQKWEEQASTLGGTKGVILYKIYLPQLLPSFRSMVFLIFVISLSQYALTSIIGGGNVLTLAMLYFPFLSSVDEAVIASFSLVFAFLPILVMLGLELTYRMVIPYQKRVFDNE
ncbi:ABC transporter permease [Bacillus sp. LL01]|uniref:ABC transporter permease n=1 Tax=Bacillus sp. LL01 TaxID=1665556 RepID=UPI00064D5E96|nr:ABC transporter permease subunit [Bacillus sp. LL01]KMJ56871.1 ABC transporter permease [Bacillus sp. LL01]